LAGDKVRNGNRSGTRSGRSCAVHHLHANDDEGCGYLAIYQVKGNEWVPVTDWAQGYRDEVMQLLRKTTGP